MEPTDWGVTADLADTFELPEVGAPEDDAAFVLAVVLDTGLLPLTANEEVTWRDRFDPTAL